MSWQASKQAIELEFCSMMHFTKTAYKVFNKNIFLSYSSSSLYLNSPQNLKQRWWGQPNWEKLKTSLKPKEKRELKHFVNFIRMSFSHIYKKRLPLCMWYISSLSEPLRLRLRVLGAFCFFFFMSSHLLLSVCCLFLRGKRQSL